MLLETCVLFILRTLKIACWSLQSYSILISTSSSLWNAQTRHHPQQILQVIGWSLQLPANVEPVTRFIVTHAPAGIYNGQQCNLRFLLENYLDICGSPKQYFWEVLAALSSGVEDENYEGEFIIRKCGFVRSWIPGKLIRIFLLWQYYGHFYKE